MMTHPDQKSAFRTREEFEIFYAEMWSHDTGEVKTQKEVSDLRAGAGYGDRPFLNALFCAWPYLNMRLAASGDEAPQLKDADRPANVAALEERIAELEGEVSVLKTPQFYGNEDSEGGTSDIESFFDDCEAGTVLEIDGYRCVKHMWASWDGRSALLFDTEAEAHAALKREGGE